MAYVIFSKRQPRIQGVIPDIPKNLRIQVLYIWRKVWGKAHYNDYFGRFELSELATDAFNLIEMTLREEHGIPSLDGDDDPDEDGYDLYRVVRDFFLKTEDTGKVIDIIELSFRYIDQEVRDISHDGIPPDSISPDEAIDQLNRRFREHNVGYQYESGEIKVDSQDSHSEGVKPAEELPNNAQQAVDNSPINNQTKYFIGHGRSLEWLKLKDFLENRLGLPYEEFNRIPQAGKFTSDRLKEMLESCCVAFLIMTGEDEHTDGTLHARSNVIHEIGLFQAQLGYERAIILLEDGCEIFSNIDGVGHIPFPEGNIRAAFEDIREVLERESII